MFLGGVARDGGGVGWFAVMVLDSSTALGMTVWGLGMTVWGEWGGGGMGGGNDGWGGVE